MRHLLIFPVAVLATGCTALGDRHEQTWLALHAIDSAQTYNIVNDPCYVEGHPVTRALIGAEPSHAEVLAWSAASAAAHVALSDYLLRTDRPKLARMWQYVTIGEKIGVTGRNFYLGVRIGAPNKTPAGCAR